MRATRKPTAAEVLAAVDRTIPDVIAPNLKVLFCGINPGLYSAAMRLHFARPGNRFWPALHASAFTPRRLFPWEQRELLEWGLGITNVVPRATAGADELKAAEFVAGWERLERKARRYRPGVIAVLGVGAFRLASGDRTARLGLQEEKLGTSRLWVLPNPSGLNAHYQPGELARLFAELREATDTW